jgi:hypothetical protein
MKIAFIISKAWRKKRHFDPVSVFSFTEQDKRFAFQNGVIINKCYSKTRGEWYQANICPYCNAFIGEHFLIDYAIELYYDQDREESGMFRYVSMGPCCPKCEFGVKEEN